MFKDLLFKKPIIIIKIWTNYKEKQKLLILSERLEYLQISQWVEDTEFEEFIQREYTNKSWTYLTSVNPEELKQSFTNNIDKLLAKEL